MQTNPAIKPTKLDVPICKEFVVSWKSNGDGFVAVWYKDFLKREAVWDPIAGLSIITFGLRKCSFKKQNVSFNEADRLIRCLIAR